VDDIALLAKSFAATM
jgi:hypothetical protein